MEERLLDGGKQQQQQGSLMRALMIVGGISVLSVILTLSFGIAVVVQNNKQTDKLSTLEDQPGDFFPETFLVPATARTPAKDQQRRGTCWIFATMGMMEGSYRKNGYAKGYLAEDEYVAFSEQVLALGLVKYCTAHPENKYCLGGPPMNTSEDGDPAWIYYMRDKVAQYITPGAVCPYKGNNEEQFECPDFDKGVKENPLNFELKDIKGAYTINQIKRLLFETKQALAWGHLVLDAAFYVPCSDPSNPKAGSDECTRCLHPCKESTDGCCSEYVAYGYTQEGIFRTYKKPVIGGGHAMTLLGWNDNFRVESGLLGHSPEKALGGFIIKNSWSPSVGHSAEYWAQKISTIEENTICPCEASAQTWMPALASCMQEGPANSTKCAPGAFKNVRGKWIKGATVLKCSSWALKNKAAAAALGWGNCDASKNYAFAALDNEPMTPWTTASPSSEVKTPLKKTL